MIVPGKKKKTLLFLQCHLDPKSRHQLFVKDGLTKIPCLGVAWGHLRLTTETGIHQSQLISVEAIF